MKGYLFDTNVLSEVRKRDCDPSVTQNLMLIPKELIYISSLTVFEMVSGAEKLRLRDRQSAKRIEEWIKETLRDFGDKIIACDLRVAETAGRLSPAHPLPIVDSLLAATALVHDLCVVTRNVNDFARSGVAYLNPFETPFRVHN